MRTLTIVPFILLSFALRDFLLLKMGPPGRVVARLRLYSIVLLSSIALFSGATCFVRTDRIMERLLSFSVVFAFVGFYGALLAVCLWVRRTNRHHLAWLLAVAPNPLLVVALALLARLAFPQDPGYAAIIPAVLFMALWIAFIHLSVRRTGLLDVLEFDFSLGFAGLVSCVALVSLPTECFLAGSADLGALLQR